MKDEAFDPATLAFYAVEESFQSGHFSKPGNWLEIVAQKAVAAPPDRKNG